MATYAPSAVELLDVWEAAHALPPVQRALALLTAARPEISPQTLAEMPIGRRDAELLALRERLFGPHIVALTRCAACGERFELTFTLGDVRVTPPDDPTVLVRRDDYAVRVRAATSLDVMDVTHAEGTAGERALLARCTLEARRGGVDVLVDEFPDAMVETLAHAISLADPQADVQMATKCPVCGHRGDAQFDVAVFLWREVEAWARRTLDEVHALASAYGWTEREILTMSASRRRRYVSMIAQAS